MNDSKLTDDDITADVIAYLRGNGASLVGVAGLDSLDSNPYSDLHKAVVYGVALDPGVLGNLVNGPDSGYSAECTRANGKLRELGTKLVTYLEERGFEAVSLGPTTENFDKEKLSVAFPHKTAATRAGLGWVGKCDLLVTREFGSALRFNTVFTSAPLKPGKPVGRSFCGECTRCVEACPVGAISGKEWCPGLYRDEFLDIKACYEECNNNFEKRDVQASICGICIAACPWTLKYLKKASTKSKT
ncbi:4Fe-4S double cluster binding domain-containing protein [Methanosarcina sp. MTP4]|uniref:4Fe-4S double cluster binding domain-containing protein n=1 Tax=Methanosarcina sp. MTP4 TaxID=1434100 RepID=UPI001E51E137|nr:4Fe-4S double cluster binding domain-containing protein [Methanosarcina sp. MTP4]